MKRFAMSIAVLISLAGAAFADDTPIGRARNVGRAHDRTIWEVPYADGVRYCYAVPASKLENGCEYAPMGWRGALPAPCCPGWNPK